ncbi:MAG: lipopolysaccharide biosynthesis protein [Mycobacteriaceae bacterium]
MGSVAGRSKSSTATREAEAVTTPQSQTDGGAVKKIAVATVFSALSGYLVLFLAAKNLGPAGYVVFSVFWAAFGFATGAATGLLQEATRAVRAGQTSRATSAAAFPVQIGLGVGVVSCMLVAASSPLWTQRIFSVNPWLSVALLSMGLCGFCTHTSIMGSLAGVDRWKQYSTLMAVDAGFRLAVALGSVVCGWAIGGFLWATVAGSFSWLLVLIFSEKTRSTFQLKADVDVLGYLRGAMHTVSASAASAVLIMGFPVLLRITSADLDAQAGVIILAVTLTRAPLLVPLTTFQGAVISYFLDRPNNKLHALLLPGAGIFTIGSLGIIAAATVGPWLFRTAFGDQYQSSPALLAGLTVGALLIAVLTLTSSATVAAAEHRWYSAGWWVATTVSLVMLFLPWAVEMRTVSALTVGPALGIVVHLWVLSRTSAEQSVVLR